MKMLLIFQRSILAPVGIVAAMLMKTAMSKNQLADSVLCETLPRKNPRAPKIPQECEPTPIDAIRPAVMPASPGPVTAAAEDVPIPPHMRAYPQTKNAVMLSA